MKRSLTFLITSLHKGGAETQLVRVATAMADRGWDVEVITLMPANAFAEALEAAGIEVRTLGIPRGRYDPRALAQLIRELRRSRPAILCTFMFHANVLGRIAGRIAGVPFIVSSVRNAIFGGRLSDLLMRWTDPLANITTTNSRLAGDALLARGVVHQDRLRVLPNGIDIAGVTSGAMERAELLASLGIEDPATQLWISVARLEPQKAHEVTLHALAKLIQSGHRSHLVIVGDGAERDRLEVLTDSLGLERHVTFLGYRTDVSSLLTASDAFVLASRWEGLPNVIMEALVAGRPVVATDVGGVTELVIDGVTGFVVPPEDAVALASAMQKVMTLSDDERWRLAAAGRAHVKDNFSLPKVMEKWDALFTEVLASKRRRGTSTPVLEQPSAHDPAHSQQVSAGEDHQGKEALTEQHHGADR